MNLLKVKLFYLFIILGGVFISGLSLYKQNFNFFWYVDKPLGFFNLIVVASVVEEILFRGILFKLFRRRYSAKWTILSTSFLFSFAHIYLHSPLWAIATFVPGILFGILRDRSGNIYASMALHYIYNLMYFSLYEF
jgi:membrane protease YdiL (CAAX protease family)